MALVRVKWTRSEEFEAEFEIDGYEWDTPATNAEVLDRIVMADDETLANAHQTTTALYVLDETVVRDGEKVNEIPAPVRAYQEDWTD